MPSASLRPSWSVRPMPIVSLVIACGLVSLPADAQLIQVIDLQDNFAVTGPPLSAPGPANPRPDRFFGNNDFGAYNVLTNNTGQAAVYQPAGRGNAFNVFSFNTPATQNDPRPGNATGNPGGADGFAQSGGGDNVVQYGLRDRYVVSVDAILPNDRLDISSGLAAAGTPNGVFTPGSLSVFFRKPPFVPGGTSIDLFNGSVNTAVPNGSGINDDNWHNFAVDFDRLNNRLQIYVDGNLTNDIDLTTFAGGIYANFSNATVGFGGAGGGPGFESYVDNFTVGSPIPEPTAAAAVGAAAAVLLRARRGRPIAR